VSTNRILNCIPSKNVEKDWLLEHAAAAGILDAAGALPPTLDLRADWWPVGDQGPTGSCVGWATAEGVLRWHLVKAGRLPKDRTLSPRFIWMGAKETDEFNQCPTTFIEMEGTSLKAALDVTRKFGAVTVEVLPFDGSLFQGEVETFYAIAAKLRIASYFNLGPAGAPWRSWLAHNGPILTRLGVDKTWADATNNGGNLDTYQPGTIRGGHAVAVVGYTADRFIIRNSWGSEWGDQGYAYASEAYAAAAFSEAYGITL
jgi:hypothetical protein